MSAQATDIEKIRSAENDYMAVVHTIYSRLALSRLVRQQETDLDAIAYFQAYLIASLPRNKYEESHKNMFRKLYYADKSSFLKCVNRYPESILLTEGKAIVAHLGIQELVFISWEDGAYRVSKNNTIVGVRRGRKNRPRGGKSEKNKEKYKSKALRRKETAAAAATAAPASPSGPSDGGSPVVAGSAAAGDSADIIKTLMEKMSKLEKQIKNLPTGGGGGLESPKKDSPRRSSPRPAAADSLKESWGDMSEEDEKRDQDGKQS